MRLKAANCEATAVEVELPLLRPFDDKVGICNHLHELIVIGDDLRPD
jgi:hypothetical protein